MYECVTNTLDALGEPISFPPTIPILFISPAPSVYPSWSSSVDPSTSAPSILSEPSNLPPCIDGFGTYPLNIIGVLGYYPWNICGLLQELQIDCEAYLNVFYGVYLYKRDQICSGCGKCVGGFLTTNHPSSLPSNNPEPSK